MKYKVADVNLGLGLILRNIKLKNKNSKHRNCSGTKNRKLLKLRNCKYVPEIHSHKNQKGYNLDEVSEMENNSKIAEKQQITSTNKIGVKIDNRSKYHLEKMVLT